MHIPIPILTLFLLLLPVLAKKSSVRRFGYWVTMFGDNTCEGTPVYRRPARAQANVCWRYKPHPATKVKKRQKFRTILANTLDRDDVGDGCRILVFEQDKCKGRFWKSPEPETGPLCSNFFSETGWEGTSLGIVCFNTHPPGQHVPQNETYISPWVENWRSDYSVISGHRPRGDGTYMLEGEFDRAQKNNMSEGSGR
ncbi:hypothetical protein K470DRAFT_277223 [Piedraia hortae CBS 480.64]|uniref:Ecp2 effector protein domain-containing protein n=1 Tax=Piedraia hortae CBS 480.64 TaxID=1314780 RepID=A0A6A7BZL5_9PEZI|nr:hypothetical protein K470DRAFT_277223 [Piedraia hortae CBS 480.64]